MKSKNLFFFSLSLILMFAACDALNNLVPKNRKSSSYWEYGAGLSFPGSFRNHHYQFELLEEDATLEITLESTDTEVAIWLYNPLGQLIDRNWGSRTITLQPTKLSVGDYYLIVGTTQRGEDGNYNLSVNGNVSELKEIKSQTLSAGAAWKTNGGGLSFPQSLRNHHYTIEVTDNNSAIDIILESDDANVALWIFNPLGQQVGRTWGDRTIFLTAESNAGTYHIIAGTQDRNVLDADYKINVNGRIKDLKQIASQDITVTGNISNGGGLNNANSPRNVTYTFEVTENNTSIDLIMESGNFDPVFWLYDPLGTLITRNWGDRRLFTIQEANIGKYTIVCGTQREGQSGAFKLSLVSKFKNFK